MNINGGCCFFFCFNQTRRCKWCFLSGRTGLCFLFGYSILTEKNPTDSAQNRTQRSNADISCDDLNPKQEVRLLRLKLRKLRAAMDANANLCGSYCVIVTYLNHKIMLWTQLALKIIVISAARTKGFWWWQMTFKNWFCVNKSHLITFFYLNVKN